MTISLLIFCIHDISWKKFLDWRFIFNVKKMFGSETELVKFSNLCRMYSYLCTSYNIGIYFTCDPLIFQPILADSQTVFTVIFGMS